MLAHPAHHIAIDDPSRIGTISRRHACRAGIAPSVVAFMATVGFSASSSAVPPELVQAVPHDVTAAYFWQGSLKEQGATGGQGVSELAAVVIDGALRIGALSMVDPALRAWIDGVAAGVVASRFPAVVVLFDTRVERTKRGGHQYADLHAALVMLTRKNNEDVERRIRHLLTSYTNQEETTLETRKEHGRVRFALHDRRLPEWTRFEWGAVGDYYLVSVGVGSFDRVIGALAHRGTSLAHSPWVKRAARKLSLTRSAIALYLRPGSLVLDADTEFRDQLDRARRALRLMGTQRSLVTLRRQNRIITVQVINDRGNRDEFQTLAGGDWARKVEPKLVPFEATRFTVIPWNAPALLHAVQNTVLALRSPRNQARLRRFWRTVETESGVSFERDIAARLGDLLIIHNAPRHPLNLPLAWTYVMPIRGESAPVRERLDTVLTYARDHTVPDAIFRLRRDPDGVWYLFAGLTGPALGVGKHDVVLSFSPTAVRDYLDRTDAR